MCLNSQNSDSGNKMNNYIQFKKNVKKKKKKQPDLIVCKHNFKKTLHS